MKTFLPKLAMPGYNKNIELLKGKFNCPLQTDWVDMYVKYEINNSNYQGTPE